MRIKPLILNKDKVLSVSVLQIFNHAIPILDKKKMNVEE